MKIEPGAIYRQYQAPAVKPAISKATAKQEERANMDQICISKAGAPRTSGRLEQEKANITSEVCASASPSRCQTLREMIERGEYYIPSQDLADAILGVPRN